MTISVIRSAVLSDYRAAIGHWQQANNCAIKISMNYKCSGKSLNKRGQRKGLVMTKTDTAVKAALLKCI